MLGRHAGVVVLMFTQLGAVAAGAGAQQLLSEAEGVRLYGTAQLVMPDAATCNVLESDTSFEERKANQGAPLDVWLLEFSVHNASVKWIDHVIARYGITSEWPACTNWSDDHQVTLMQRFGFEVAGLVAWAGASGHIQRSGRNVVAPGETLTEKRLVIVLRGEPAPRFNDWWLDVDFGEGTGAEAEASSRGSGEAVTERARLNAAKEEARLNAAKERAHLNVAGVTVTSPGTIADEGVNWAVDGAERDVAGGGASPPGSTPRWGRLSDALRPDEVRRAEMTAERPAFGVGFGRLSGALGFGR